MRVSTLPHTHHNTDIMPGQGMYLSSISNTFRAVNCDTDSYGVANITYGLSVLPCRACPGPGMQTSTLSPLSMQYWASDGISGRQGFTHPLACVTKPGYGYQGRSANKCPVGSFNSGGSYDSCSPCPRPGLSTPDAASGQVSVDNCTLAPGYGFHDNAIVPCPIGESSNGCDSKVLLLIVPR